MARFINRKPITAPTRRVFMNIQNVNENNEILNTEENMTTQEKIEKAASILAQANAEITNVKRVKKDKGLIERTESSKVVLTEDNKELLID